ncbi:MAG TPA: PP2C family protein-serine/threonine phosphatase [Tetrasphaera sp.]|nr:PP2C family protein-serine/threonine phosphatase [Tetrasphaera sp.]
MQVRLGQIRLSQRARLVMLMVMVAGSAALHITWPDEFPLLTLAPWVVVAGLFLSPAPLIGLYVFIAGLLALVFWIVPTTPLRAITVLSSMAAGMIAMYALSASRASLGTYGTRSNRMLVELRTRQQQLAVLPALPEGYRAEAAVVGAFGDAFAGDVLISAPGFHPGHLEFALIDVSGNGLRAGSRGLMVAGAFSGLLGQVEPERFLSAANAYLVRQPWREGFATAVHLEIDPATDRFWISSAGHPPAMRCSAARNTWDPLQGEQGPALGLIDGIPFPRMEGEVHTGDALILYTDGIVETRTGELLDGIDWMGGVAERALQVGFEGFAAYLCREALGGDGDDRGALVVWKP